MNWDTVDGNCSSRIGPYRFIARLEDLPPRRWILDVREEGKPGHIRITPGTGLKWPYLYAAKQAAWCWLYGYQMARTSEPRLEGLKVDRDFVGYDPTTFWQSDLY